MRNSKNPNPYVVVRHPGTDDEDIVADFPTADKARAYMKDEPDTDLMKRLADGTLTSDF